MKKTLTVNLNNIVFHIDDDAYEMLHTYLSEISDHFKSDEEKKEIMNDIEARIAELFTEKLQKNKNVVNLIDVQEIIEIMGKPSQYADADDQTEAPKTDKKQPKARRYYRDPDNAVLGGVAGGLAAYFSWDVTWVRIAFVLLALVSAGYMIPIYIIVWLIAPQATTASQRLEMQGEDVTVDNIKTELNNVKNYMESDKFKQSATSVGERLLEVLRLTFKVVFGFIGAVLGLVGILIVGVLIFLLFFLIFEPTVLNNFAPGIITNWANVTPENAVLIFISLILVIGCPIFMLIYWAIWAFSGRHNSMRNASLVVFILWLAGLFMFYSVGANTFLHWNKNSGHPWFVNMSDDDSPAVDEERSCDPFHSIEISGNIELVLNQDTMQKIVVSSQPDYMSRIITKVENGVLYIYTDGVTLNRDIKVNVSNDSIRSLVAKGACSIKTDSMFIFSDLKIELLGASEADMDVQVSRMFKIDLKGASSVDLSGTCDELKLYAVGASSVEANDLISKDAYVYVAGASNAQVYATQSIDAEAYGASEIDCKGSPKTIKKSTHVPSSIEIE